MTFLPQKYLINFSPVQHRKPAPHDRNVKTHRRRDRLAQPAEVTTEIIGKKWKGKILYFLLDGTKRFGELRRLISEATYRMFTAQLRQLEADGMVERRIDTEALPKVEYSLAKRGKDLTG